MLNVKTSQFLAATLLIKQYAVSYGICKESDPVQVFLPHMEENPEFAKDLVTFAASQEISPETVSLMTKVISQNYKDVDDMLIEYWHMVSLEEE